MAQMNSYTDYKSGTTSAEQEKLLETGKVLFSGKKTDNGDPITLSIPVSELGGSDLPDVGTNTNRGKFLAVKTNKDELEWTAPLYIENDEEWVNNQPQYTPLINTKSKVKLYSGLHYNNDSAGIGIRCKANGGLHASDDGIEIKTDNVQAGQVLTYTAEGIVWANAPAATIDTTGANDGDVLTFKSGTGITWAAPSGGGSSGQIIIEYDCADSSATYNGQPITANAAIALCDENPNMVVNIFNTYQGHKYSWGSAPLSRIYEKRGLIFSMQQFSSNGGVEEYLIVHAVPGDGDPESAYPDGYWSHETQYPN